MDVYTGNKCCIHIFCRLSPDLEGQGQGEGGDDEELDEDTRRFNFWTHQIHIFFTRKFFNAADHLIALNKLVMVRRIEDERKKIAAAEAAAKTATAEAAAMMEQLPKPPTTPGDSGTSLQVAS
jgi:hypothetical protein